MKLAPVLVKYLTENKTLSLPGIGTFTSESAYDPDYDGKKAAPANKITFNPEKVEAADAGLVDFIAKETGKMRVLASSDLSSQLEDAIQFIITGKPYFFPGIGTLTQKIDGSLDFSPEKYTQAHERKKEIPITEKNTVPQTYIDGNNKKRGSLRPALTIITLALIAIAATVWFYMKNAEDQKAATQDITESDTSGVAITLPVDSNALKSSATAPSGSATTYTYVLEVAKEPRASKRFNQLQTINWPVELEVIDSLHKRIVMKLPIAGSDSARIKDSLSVLSGRKVFIAP